MPAYTHCWTCEGHGTQSDPYDPGAPCPRCDGTGLRQLTRDESWCRSKKPGETWPRYSVEVPPELAREIDAAQRRSLGVNASTLGRSLRASAARAALNLLLRTLDPERTPTPYDANGDAVEVVELPTGAIP